MHCLAGNEISAGLLSCGIKFVSNYCVRMILFFTFAATKMK
jgi:hypothetical protein